MLKIKMIVLFVGRDQIEARGAQDVAAGRAKVVAGRAKVVAGRARVVVGSSKFSRRKLKNGRTGRVVQNG